MNRTTATPTAIRRRAFATDAEIEVAEQTIKDWMVGWTHFLTKTLARVRTEMSLHVLAYNLKRVMRILGIVGMMRAMNV